MFAMLENVFLNDLGSTHFDTNLEFVQLCYDFNSGLVI